MNMLLQIDSLLLPLNKNSSEALLKQALSDRIQTGVEYRLRTFDCNPVCLHRFRSYGAWDKKVTAFL